MGLLGFLKKKAPDQPLAPPPVLSPVTIDSTELPSIDGTDLDVNTIPQMPASPQMSASNAQDQAAASRSISVNIPTLDFSMPPLDDGLEMPAQNSLPEINTPQPQDLNLQVQQNSPEVISPEDINSLFVSDDGWKEPDWATFDPYTEDKIDEPKPEDFGVSGLPKFDESQMTGPMISDEPVISPDDPYKGKNRAKTSPVELFIRGRAYNRVFVELDQMSRTLSKIDSDVTSYEDLLKREEPLLMTAKEQMEYLYKRLNTLDRKIFVQ